MVDLVSVRGLRVRRGPRVVLDGVDLDVRPGDRLAVLGPNGAGKSTLLKALAGLLPTDGALTIGGRPGRELSHAERARLVAYVPQHSALEAPIPVADVVAQGRFAYGGSLSRPSARDRDAIADAMRLVDVGAIADRPFSRLSYGERRRVLLARALATEAPLVLLDEPTAALDVGHALALFEVLADLANAGRALIVVLHALQEALMFADRALLIDEGRPVAAGPTREVLSPEHVRAVYGVELVPGGGVGVRLAREVPA